MKPKYVSQVTKWVGWVMGQNEQLSRTSWVGLTNLQNFLPILDKLIEKNVTGKLLLLQQ